jgi:hypothetical protein
MYCIGNDVDGGRFSKSLRPWMDIAQSLLVVNDVPAESCCLQVFLFSLPKAGDGGLVNGTPTPALGKIYIGPNDHYTPYGVGVPFTNTLLKSWQEIIEEIMR